MTFFATQEFSHSLDPLRSYAIRAICRWPGRKRTLGEPRACRVATLPYLNSGTRSFTLASLEAGLSPAGTSCCRGRASILLRGTEAPQRAARGGAVCWRGVGAVAGHLTIDARAGLAGRHHPLVPDRGADCLPVLDRLRVVLRIHAAGDQARIRCSAERISYPFHRAQTGFCDHR